MNYKKSLTLLGIVPLLIGCANKGPYGEYAFQMGKAKDTHIAVSLKLTKDNYDESNADKGQKFELGLDLMTSDVESSYSEILKELSPITGYYSIDKNVKVYDETRLNIGINFLGEYELPTKITDLLFVASINKNIVNFYLPVSIDDLMFQLYWYGYDLSSTKWNSEEVTDDDFLVTPEGKHDIGTHPTAEEIATINTHYADDHDGKVYRDFHILKLGLSKK